MYQYPTRKSSTSGTASVNVLPILPWGLQLQEWDVERFNFPQRIWLYPNISMESRGAAPREVLAVNILTRLIQGRGIRVVIGATLLRALYSLRQHSLSNACQKEKRAGPTLADSAGLLLGGQIEFEGMSELFKQPRGAITTQLDAQNVCVAHAASPGTRPIVPAGIVCWSGASTEQPDEPQKRGKLAR